MLDIHAWIIFLVTWGVISSFFLKLLISTNGCLAAWPLVCLAVWPLGRFGPLATWPFGHFAPRFALCLAVLLFV